MIPNETITFNKEDWSGQKATIKVKDNKFEYYGYEFELKEKTETFDDDQFKFVEVFVDGDLGFTLLEIDGEYYYEDECGDFVRSHKNPAILTSIIASNLF
tara:strand:+ start:100 stop:399 length:300 start_codon:yes stop_codon:yes gene_type:complete